MAKNIQKTKPKKAESILSRVKLFFEEIPEGKISNKKKRSVRARTLSRSRRRK